MCDVSIFRVAVLQFWTGQIFGSYPRSKILSGLESRPANFLLEFRASVLNILLFCFNLCDDSSDILDDNTVDLDGLYSYERLSPNLWLNVVSSMAEAPPAKDDSDEVE